MANTEHYGITKINGTEDISPAPINTAFDKIDTEIWKLFQYRGDLGSANSLNDLSGNGFWRIAGTLPLNAPPDFTWSFVLQVEYGSLTHQYAFKPASKSMLIREYSGSPQVWSTWKPIAGYTSIERVTYDSNGSYFEYWRSGQTACIKMFYKVESGSINAWSVKELGVVPNDFRPVQVVMTRGCVDRQSDDGTCFSVDSNGSVKIQTRFNPFSAGGDVLQGVLTYPVRY